MQNNNLELNFYNHGKNIAKNAYEEYIKVSKHILETYGKDAQLQYQCGYKEGVNELLNEISKDIDANDLDNRIIGAINESKER